MRDYDQSALLALLKQMKVNKRPCPLILLLGPDEIAISQIKAVSPETTVILRVYPGADVPQYFDVMNSERIKADAHQTENESTDWSPQGMTKRRNAMIWSQAHGFKLATPTPSTGYPDISNWSQPYVWDFLRFVRDNGHYLAIHEYDIAGQGDWTLYRFLHHVLPLLPADLQGNMPRVVFTEFGIQKARDMGRDQWLAYMKSWQAELSKYPFVVGAALWAVGDTGGSANPGEDWQADNWENKIDLLSQV